MRFSIVLVLVGLLVSCGGAERAATTEGVIADPLEASLRRAAADHVAITDVEAVIGSRAVLLTSREADRGPLSIVDLAPDPLRADCPPAGDLSRVAGAGYWSLGSDDAHGNPRMVGLRWSESGDVEVFCAVVLPP